MRRKRTRRTTHIEVEIGETVAVRQIAPTAVWCPDCGHQVPMYSPEMAAALVRVDIHTIYCWIDEQKIHSVPAPQGGLRLCLLSLCRIASRPRDQ